jgi:hypothetical protein
MDPTCQRYFNPTSSPIPTSSGHPSVSCSLPTPAPLPLSHTDAASQSPILPPPRRRASPLHALASPHHLELASRAAYHRSLPANRGDEGHRNWRWMRHLPVAAGRLGCRCCTSLSSPAASGAGAGRGTAEPLGCGCGWVVAGLLGRGRGTGHRRIYRYKFPLPLHGQRGGSSVAAREGGPLAPSPDEGEEKGLLQLRVGGGKMRPPHLSGHG